MNKIDQEGHLQTLSTSPTHSHFLKGFQLYSSSNTFPEAKGAKSWEGILQVTQPSSLQGSTHYSYGSQKSRGTCLKFRSLSLAAKYSDSIAIRMDQEFSLPSSQCDSNAGNLQNALQEMLSKALMPHQCFRISGDVVLASKQAASLQTNLIIKRSCLIFSLLVPALQSKTTCYSPSPVATFWR